MTLQPREPLSVEQYLDQVLGGLTPLPSVTVSLKNVLGRVLTHDVLAPHNLPLFKNSQMDGYAVRASDLNSARPQEPVTLKVVADLAAGEAVGAGVEPGTAIRIMTGAPVPSGADAIIPREDTDDGRQLVTIPAPTEPGRFIREAGDDVTIGDLVVRRGIVIGPRQIGVLASLGVDEVQVSARPRVAVIPTGRELREPGAPLTEGAIFDGNSPMLAAALRDTGAELIDVAIQPDDVSVLRNTIEELAESADLIMTIGGISMGDHDVVKAALTGDVDFVRVKMQPGQPQGFGHLGERRVPVLSLPGNPVSSYVSFEVFVRPALARLTGRSRELPTLSTATITDALTSPLGKRQYMRARLDPQTAEVAPVGGPGSHLIGSLAASNALLVIPEDTTAIAAGETVAVLDLERNSL